ncbi:MAG: hypothetical protein ACFFDK_19630 [Promethearchaeota archaeon]
MEELFPKLSETLKNAVEIIENENQLLIELKVKIKDYVPGDLGSPNEIREMIRIFGGVAEEIPIEIDVNEDFKTVLLQMKNREEFEIIRTNLKTIWQRAAELLQKAFDAEPGKTEEFRALGDFDETY